VDTNRLEAFSDGVFAIAITLLVLNLTVPSTTGPGSAESLARKLQHHWPSYSAYVVSFLVIGIIWVNHHYVFKLIVQVDRPLLFINLMLLMAVSVLPFPTAMLAEYIQHGPADSHLAAAIYSATMLVMSLAFSGLWLWVTRESGSLLHDRLDRVIARRALRRFGLGCLVYLVTVGLAFLNAVLTLSVHFLLAVYYAFDQLPVDSGADKEGNP
jgi:uncharacterized membrane protein